jgi:hypothetical protein
VDKLMDGRKKPKPDMGSLGKMAAVQSISAYYTRTDKKNRNTYKDNGYFAEIRIM